MPELIPAEPLTPEWHAARHFRSYVLCNARDGRYGRCTLPAGHGGGRWHLEMRRGRIWANWRGPIPGERCGVCGTDHRPGAHHV